ncbi:MAG: deoxyribodipyrimidine photo-lyase [Rhodobacteraceae bacterium]|nr:deoxyribodipyrimidine photo-lyase [Paracoccaceae bacterium]
MTAPPMILWFRRDFRLADNPMLAAAAATGRPLIAVAICDEVVETLGAAPKWRWGAAVAAFAARLERIGARLILRRGRAQEVLDRLIVETGATAVWWGRLYDPAAKARDSAVKAALRARGIDAQSFPGFLLHEPWAVATGQGGPYRVYTPYWNAVKGRPVALPAPPVTGLRPPAVWPDGDRLEEWHLGQAMRAGGAIVAQYARVGEAAAQDRLADFLATRVACYREARDFPAGDATSRLSENLAVGEIGPRQIWHAGQRALHEGARGAEHFLKELVWREFAWHLMHHFPELATRNWRPDWDAFPWRGDSPEAERWRRGMTGEPFVDAALREMYVTGTMHNRARMIAASYLTKHLMTDWRVGLAWFAECLIDWDPAANAMGWQWVAGSGPDAAPYFRVFNPATQAAKFDASGEYRRRFIAELSREPGREARDYFRAAPVSWALDPAAPYPAPLVALDAGRARALAAYAQRGA